MHRIGVIGDKDSIFGFKTLGISVYQVSDGSEAEKTLHMLAEEGFGVIYITEQFAESMMPALEKYKSSKYPAIVPIPGIREHKDLGRKEIKKAVEKAVGADILFKDG